jgi:hypothetical protein
LSSYGSCGPVTQDGVPNHGDFTYLQGTLLGPGDLPLYVNNSDGLPIDPYGVFWTVYNAIGSPVTLKTAAMRSGVGGYYAYWDTNVGSGDYTIAWEYMEQFDSPVEAKSMRFSVISPCAPYAPLAPYEFECGCGSNICQQTAVILAPSVLTPCISPCPSTPCITGSPCSPVYIPVSYPSQTGGQCCQYEIPRAVHLTSQLLPVGGGFTNQPSYIIPERIRHITFYVTYTRGAVGGYPEFKVLWGNGVEETQETMTDMNYDVLPTSTAIQNMYLQDLTGPIPDSDAPVNSIIYVSIPGGATTVRLIASEKGKPGTQGTVGVSLTASS